MITNMCLVCTKIAKQHNIIIASNSSPKDAVIMCQHLWPIQILARINNWFRVGIMAVVLGIHVGCC